MSPWHGQQQQQPHQHGSDLQERSRKQRTVKALAQLFAFFLLAGLASLRTTNQSTSSFSYNYDHLWESAASASTAISTNTATTSNVGNNHTTNDNNEITSNQTIAPTIQHDNPTISESSPSPSSPSFSLKESFDLALERTTKLLYKDCDASERNYWLSQPPPIIYIYNNLSPEWSDIHNISTCIDHHFDLYNPVFPQWNNCHWEPKKPCTDIHGPKASSKRKKFMGYRYNLNSDVSYLMRFQKTYPKEYQTTDPNEADLFVVPYPHKSHCLCHKKWMLQRPKCVVPPEEIQSQVLDRLFYFNHKQEENESNNTTTNNNHTFHSVIAPDRHLFLYGAGKGHQQVPELVRAAKASFTLSLGPVDVQTGDIAVPYTSTVPELQPSSKYYNDDDNDDDDDYSLSLSLSLSNSSNSWWTAERPFAVGAVFGTSDVLSERTEFFQKKQKYVGSTIGGKPNAILSLGGKARDASKVNFMELYRNSTFCLILPGDECNQKRFFDTILNGCIPVTKVFHDKVTGEPSLVSQHCKLSATYPFSRGTLSTTPTSRGVGNNNDNQAHVGAAAAAGNNSHHHHYHHATKAGIDLLQDIVLTYDGECGFACLKAPMEQLLANRTALREHQLRLRDYASLVGFGLSNDSYQYPDAFMATIVTLRHKLWYRMGKNPSGI